MVPLLGAVVVCYGGEGGDDQLWGSGRGAFDNTKIGFCYRGVYAGIILYFSTISSTDNSYTQQSSYIS